MKAEWEKKSSNHGILTVEVDEERFNRALDQAFHKVVKKVTVPGFRKGKVPRIIFESRFGVESLYQEAVDLLLPEAYDEAVKSTGIIPVDRPEIDVEQLEKGKPFIFKATVTVKPDVELGEYVGVTVEKKEFPVTDEDVENELLARRERVATIETLENPDASVENGDITRIDFEGFLNGEPFEGGKGENHELTIGSGAFIPGFEEKLIGMKPGEEKEITVTFPESYHTEELAGKEAVFKVKIREIRRKNLPELDDEFAKDVSEFETLEEFKADIREKLLKRAKESEEDALKDEVVEKVTAQAKIDLPEVMIREEAHHMVHEFEDTLRAQGLTLDLYFQYTGLNEEAMMDQYMESAEKRVRSSLVLEAIAEKEGIEPTEEEMNREIDELAKLYRTTREELMPQLEKFGSLPVIRNRLRIRKTVDWLLEKAHVVEKEKSEEKESSGVNEAEENIK
ncbi:MAG: trigger factor [Thermicanus sp.]|nr:trigger factor [Thermicanus sp.]